MPTEVDLAAAQAKAHAQRLLRLREERRRVDPLFHFQRTATQEACYACLAPNRVLIGGNRTGKTTAVIAECAAFARGLHKYRPWYGPVKCLVVVPGRDQAAGIWSKRFLQRCDLMGEIGNHPLLPKWEIGTKNNGKQQDIAWNVSGLGRYAKLIRLTNGSEIYVMLSGDVKAWERIQGFDFDAIFRDEASGNRNLGTELMTRVMQNRGRPDKPHGGFILWGASPTLVNQEFDEFCYRAESGQDGYAMFRIASTENPAVTAEAREQMRESMSEQDAAIRLDGSATATAGVQIYQKQWSNDRHILPEDYEPGPYDNLWVSYDPGGVGETSNHTGMVVGCVRQEWPRRIIVVKTFLHRKTTLREDVQILKSWLRGRFIVGMVYDPACNRREKGSGKSIREQIWEIMEDEEVVSHYGLIQPYNRHAPGIALVKDYLDPDPSDKRAPPLLVWNPSEEHAAWLFRNYRSYEEGQYTGEHSIVLKDTEIPDCVRYLVDRRPTWERFEEPNWALWDEELTTAVSNERKTAEQVRFERQCELSALAAKRRANTQRRRLGTGW